MIYEVYDKFNEYNFYVLNVEKVIESTFTFKFKYNNGTYSREYLKGNYEYYKTWYERGEKNEFNKFEQIHESNPTS